MEMFEEIGQLLLALVLSPFILAAVLVPWVWLKVKELAGRAADWFVYLASGEWLD